jgi:hypothetical protein
MFLYNGQTKRVHPILSDDTLRHVFNRLANIRDTEREQFDNVAGLQIESNPEYSYLDSMVIKHFERKHHRKTDYSITHFVYSEEYLEKLANGVVDH